MPLGWACSRPHAHPHEETLLDMFLGLGEQPWGIGVLKTSWLYLAEHVMNGIDGNSCQFTKQQKGLEVWRSVLSGTHRQMQDPCASECS